MWIINKENLKNDKLPSRDKVSNTGPRASKEKVLYCTVVTWDLCLARWRWDRDSAPVREFIVTVYTHPCTVSRWKACFRKISVEAYCYSITETSNLTAYLSITTENKLTCVVMVHSCYLTVKNRLIDCSASTKIEHLKCQLQNNDMEELSEFKKICILWKEKRVETMLNYILTRKVVLITVISLFALPAERKLLFICTDKIAKENFPCTNQFHSWD